MTEEIESNSLRIGIAPTLAPRPSSWNCIIVRDFLDQHPPRVNWDKLRQGPTSADIKAVPPASAEEWERDGYLVSPLPESASPKREGGAKLTPRRKDTVPAAE